MQTRPISLLAAAVLLSTGCSSSPADPSPSTSTDGGSQACVLEQPQIGPGLHVSPTGTPDGAGTEASPIDLATALSEDGPAQPGDTLYLAGGTYRGKFVSTLRGRSGAPIVVRARPGERVTLDGETGDGHVLTIEGEWAHFVDLEVTASDPTRSDFPDGIYITGPNTKVIDCVVHDTAQGISFWTPAVDSELYGNVVYNNGWPATDRGHGHAVYTQNLEGTKLIRDNVFFFGFSFGIHAYTEGGSIQGFDIRRNAWFSAGASVPGADGLKDNCLVGGAQPVDRTVLAENLGWARTPTSRGVRLGYYDGVANVSASLLDNLFVGELAFASTWSSVTATGNEIYGSSSFVTPATHPDNQFSDALPSGTRVFLHPNAYDAGRANLVIYNGEDAPTVPVDLSPAVAPGARYEIFSVYDLFGEPVVSGVWAGGTVPVPMGSKPPPQPVGLADAIVESDDPGRAFGVFVVKHTPCRRRPRGRASTGPAGEPSPCLAFLEQAFEPERRDRSRVPRPPMERACR